MKPDPECVSLRQSPRIKKDAWPDPLTTAQLKAKLAKQLTAIYKAQAEKWGLK